MKSFLSGMNNFLFPLNTVRYCIRRTLRIHIGVLWDHQKTQYAAVKVSKYYFYAQNSHACHTSHIDSSMTILIPYDYFLSMIYAKRKTEVTIFFRIKSLQVRSSLLILSLLSLCFPFFRGEIYIYIYLYPFTFPVSFFMLGCLLR